VAAAVIGAPVDPWMFEYLGSLQMPAALDNLKILDFSRVLA
jgi:hypothetical protein